MRKPSLFIIFLTVFIDLIGFGIVLPLLPMYSRQFGASGLEIGLIIASFSAMQFLFAPAWGRLSDRIGRRPVILVSTAGSVVAYGLFAYASSLQGSTGLWLLLASRVFAGICGANLSVASAYIADVSTRENRSKSMALIGMAFGFGFIIGPALGSFSAKAFGLAGPGIVASVLCAFNFIFACFALVESRKPSSDYVPPRPKLQQFIHTITKPQVGLLIGIYFLATFCFACFEATFSLFLEDRLNYDIKQVGYLFTYCGVLSVLIQGAGMGRLVKRFGEPKLITVSLLLFGAGLAVLPFINGLGTLLFALTLIAGGSGLNRPPTFGLISLHTTTEQQGEVLGVAQSAGSLARIFGPIFATWFYQYSPATPYLICAAISLIAMVIGAARLTRAH